MTDPPTLIGGPYLPPAGRSHRPGRTVGCAVRGEVVICGASDAPLPWLVAKSGPTSNAALPVVTPELARAVRTESRQAVAYWWGVSISTAWRWRRALGVQRYNPGTLARWAELARAKLTDEARRKALRRYRAGLARRRAERATMLG